jgi:hypothetical protein
LLHHVARTEIGEPLSEPAGASMPTVETAGAASGTRSLEPERNLRAGEPQHFFFCHRQGLWQHRAGYGKVLAQRADSDLALCRGGFLGFRQQWQHFL